MSRRFAFALLSVAFLGISSLQAWPVRGGGPIHPDQRPGVFSPNIGVPFSHYYGYLVTQPQVPFADNNSLQWMDYFDRLDRAEKFGYPIPPEPTVPNSPSPRRFGFGIFRAR